MITIEVKDSTTTYPKLNAPALPRINDKLRSPEFAGTVTSVEFVWDEHGEVFVQVEIGDAE